MKPFIAFLLLATLAQSQEPVRTYSDGYAIAKAERRPLLVFLTQANCVIASWSKWTQTSLR